MKNIFFSILLVVTVSARASINCSSPSDDTRNFHLSISGANAVLFDGTQYLGVLHSTYGFLILPSSLDFTPFVQDSPEGYQAVFKFNSDTSGSALVFKINQSQAVFAGKLVCPANKTLPNDEEEK